MSYSIHTLKFATRFVRGYKFLDRTGEVLLKLEDALDKNWLPGDLSPNSGSMKNEILGMNLSFNAEQVSVKQEGFISAEHFIDQLCIIVDIVTATFDINTIISPSFAIDYQRGFDSENSADAETALFKLGLVSVHDKVNEILGPKPLAMSYACVNRYLDSWKDTNVPNSRRLGVQTIRQKVVENIDQRMLLRAELLPRKHAETLKASLNLRSKIPRKHLLALLIEFENRLDGELKKMLFSCFDFANESINWAQDAIASIQRITDRKKVEMPTDKEHEVVL
jgi:hypothetical protein